MPPFRRILLALPAVVAGAVVLFQPAWLRALASDPAAARLADALIAMSWIAPALAALAAARFNQSRLAIAGFLVAAMAFGLAHDLLPLEGPGAPALMITCALAFGLLGHLDERGVTTTAGLRRGVLLAVLAFLPAQLALARPDDLLRALGGLGPVAQPTAGTGVPWVAIIGMAWIAQSLGRARGRDADVAGMGALAGMLCMVAAISISEGSASGAPPLAVAVLGCGAGATLLLGAHVVAWRRSYVDDLTGLHGRRALDEALDGLSGAHAIAVIDVDFFKRFNDEHGHDAGDQALRIVAGVLARTRGGKAYRQGGEEFVVVFAGAPLDDAAEEMEALRAAIEATPLLVRSRGRRKALRVTASIGVAARTPACATARDVLRAADQALLRAKRLGRNRVEVERRKQPRPVAAPVRAAARSSRTARARP